jgi:hypothetical protein
MAHSGLGITLSLQAVRRACQCRGTEHYRRHADGCLLIAASIKQRAAGSHPLVAISGQQAVFGFL